MCASPSIKLVRVFGYSILMSFFAMPVVVMADAGLTSVFLYPSSQTVGAVGDSFTVNVSIADVANLYGYGFKLYYDSTVMNGTQVIQGSFLKGGSQIVLSFTDHYNSSRGLVWVDCFLIGNVSGMSGSGVLATIEFESVNVATSSPLHLADVELSDSHVSVIPHEDVDGIVTVVPEFTSFAAFLTLIIASMFGVLAGKRAIRISRISAERTNHASGPD
jgi:hypothetical protein